MLSSHLCRYVSALTTPARLSPVEFHYPPLPPQVPTFQITSPNTSHALSLPPAAAAYQRDDDQPLLRCPDVRSQIKRKDKNTTVPVILKASHQVPYLSIHIQIKLYKTENQHVPILLLMIKEAKFYTTGMCTFSFR